MNRRELHELQVARHGRQLEDDVIPYALPDERAADERAHAHVALLELDRIPEHETEGLRGLRLLIFDHDSRSETNLVGGNLGQVDLRQLTQALTELAESRLHELLALEGGLVLAVLAQVAELDRLPNLGRKDDVKLVL